MMNPTMALEEPYAILECRTLEGSLKHDETMKLAYLVIVVFSEGTA